MWIGVFQSDTFVLHGTKDRKIDSINSKTETLAIFGKLAID